jgi:eukaryotic-like serine/threonine-protein kinase
MIMPALSVSTFVEFLRTRNILRPGQLDQLAADPQMETAEPPRIAEMLVRRGWLTQYQADQLLQAEGQNLVVGPYVLLEPLGEGGMGQVFKARHRMLERIVAIKLIREERISTDPEAIRRFQREARAAALLSHPNIVLIYDADCSGSTYFIAMEYIEGTDLARLVKEQGPLAVAQACDYVHQAALGLAHAHEKGMVHRDIKPSNLLASGLNLKRAEHPSPTAVPGSGVATRVIRRPVRPSAIRADGTESSAPPVIKILDMGLARVVQGDDSHSQNASLTQEGSIVGTPDFIAPEQARDAHRVDIRADLYSLGCTFFYLLTGQAPFPNGSTIEKLLMHQLDDAPEVDKVRKDVPAEVSLIVRKLMAKSPGQRYQTPAELLAALAASHPQDSPAPNPARRGRLA